VHNSYLQIGSEFGFIGLVIVAWLVGYWWVSAITHLRKYIQCRSKNHSQENQMMTQFGFSFFFGGLAFLVHNVVDFDFYVFPLGVLGVSLLALTLNVLSPTPSKIGSSRNMLKNPRVLARYGLILCILLLMCVIDWQYGYGKQQQENAVALVQASQYEEAHPYIRQALRSIPRVPEYMALEGSLLVYLHKADSAIPYFQSAIQHEPETPWFHAGLAEAYLENHNLSMAYVERRRAAELFPQKLQYQKRVQEIHTLLSIQKP
jgi:tetratricopeptide (TPR) repeat protein